MRRQPEQDRRREAVALALGALRLRYVGVLEVAVGVLLDDLGFRDECDHRPGHPEAYAVIRTVRELAAAGRWAAAEAFFEEATANVLLN